MGGKGGAGTPRDLHRIREKVGWLPTSPITQIAHLPIRGPFPPNPRTHLCITAVLHNLFIAADRSAYVNGSQTYMCRVEVLKPLCVCKTTVGSVIADSSTARAVKSVSWVSAADKGCRVYPLDPRPDAVLLYSGCTPGNSHAWFLPDDRYTASLVGLRGGWRHARMKMFTRTYGSNAALPGSPTLPQTIKAGYLNCKIRPYIPNPLRCFKCQSFGHSKTACRGQLTCSRCPFVGHASSDCRLELKCVNCSQPHTIDSKLCPKWKTEKEIQTLKTNKHISYLEARKLIGPQPSQTYAQAAKSITINNYTQTDENITKIKCPPLQLLPPLSSVPQPNAFPSIPPVSISSSTTHTNILPSASSIKPTTQIESWLPEPISSSAAPDNSLNTSDSSLSAYTCPFLTISYTFAALQSSISLSESAITIPNSELSNTSKVPQNVKQNSKNRRKRTKAQKAEIEIKMAKHKPRKAGPTELTTDDEKMIMYDVQTEELEPNPDDKFAMKECFINNPNEYMLALTPTRFRKVDLTHEHNNDYGRQRVWSILGSFCGPPIAGFLLHGINITGNENRYTMAFITTIVFTLLSALSLWQVKTKFYKPSAKMWRKALVMARKLEVWLFVLLLMVMGSCFGFRAIYGGWYLQGIGATDLLLGVSRGMSDAYGLPFLYSSKWWINKIGYRAIFIFCLLGNAIYCFSFSFLEVPWPAVIIESTLILAYHLYWVAAMQYVICIAPEGLQATVRALAGSIQYNLSKVITTTVGGYLMSEYGGRTAFRVFGSIALTYAIVYASYLRMDHLRKKKRKIQSK
ncbi:hypothetical protein TNCV_252271 [Trichonephila clavipes]|nr:hypothetical protein TNCV_252271 [Trichonephila clavipes]